jgi:dihydroorotase
LENEIKIINARVFTEVGIRTGGLNIKDGVITKISSDKNLEPAKVTINANNNLLIPGLIDVHVHLRDLKQSNKETFRSGSAAAAKGGITSIIDMPNNDPPIISLKNIKDKLEKAKSQILVNTGFYSGIPNKIEEITELIKIGVFGFKIYLNKPICNLNIYNKDLLIKILSEISKYNSTVLFHAEILDNNIGEKKIGNDLKEQINDFLKLHEEKSEIKAVKYILDVTKNLNLQTHFCHMTTQKAIDIIFNENTENLYSIEVTPHHLFLDSSFLMNKRAIAKTVPPLRNKKEVKKLWDLINNKNKINLIASDHAPHIFEEKKLPFNLAPSGIPGLETLLPLFLTKINQGIISLARFIELASTNPAKIMKVEKRGLIKVGFFADLVMIDPKVEYFIDPQNFLSKAKFSPFEGFKVKGRVEKTFVNGQLVYDNDLGIILDAKGLIIKPYSI